MTLIRRLKHRLLCDVTGIIGAGSSASFFMESCFCYMLYFKMFLTLNSFKNTVSCIV